MMIVFMRSFIVLFFLACLPSCTSDDNSKEIDSVPKSIVVNNSRIKWIESVHVGATVKKYVISKENTQRTGTFFTGYHQIGEGLLLVDRYSSNINCVDGKGEILWEIRPPSPGIDRYVNIGALDVDSELKEIYISDRSLNRIDVFSFDGDYKRSIQPPFSFMDFEVLGADNIVYDISQKDQRELMEDGQRMRYLFQGESETRLAFLLDPEFDTNATPFSGFNRFSRSGGAVFHRLPFENTSYRIANDGEIVSSVIVDFSVNNEFAKIGLNKSISAKAMFVYENEIPWPLDIIHSSKNDMVSVIYKVGFDCFFSSNVEGEQVVDPAYYYDFDGEIIPGPKYYESEKFYLQINKSKYDYLQQQFLKGVFLKEDVLKGIDSVENKVGDYDDIMIICIDLNS